MIRAVIDTNVLVSGLRSPAGNEAKILLAFRQTLLSTCLSEDITTEYADVIARPKFSFSPDAIAATLTMFRDRGELILSVGVPPDPDDAKFLHCAGSGGAEFIVTGNERHFPPENCDPIRVVNAGELLARITLDI